jgi:hypothetical protein
MRNKVRVDAEGVYRSRLVSRIPFFEHYSEGRASWVFDMYQFFFQAINAPLKVRNVVIGPFDLETRTLADRHAES